MTKENIKLFSEMHAEPSWLADLRQKAFDKICLLYTSPSPRDQRGYRMPSSA